MKQNASSRNTHGEWIVHAPNELLKFLFEQMPSRSRNSIKGILSRGQVSINAKVSTQYNAPLKEGDTVKIQARVASDDVKLKGLSIMYEDNDLLVIEKDAGLLSVGTKKERHNTAYRQLTDYVKSIHPHNRIFVVHRLDRETSGVMIFAKNEHTQQTLQNSWQETMKERSYVALVEGVVKKDGTEVSWLNENKAFYVYSSKRPDDGHKAITHYQVLKNNRKFSLLSVQLETGRKNQIRVHMQDLGHPVVGDKKYGATTNSLGRLGLHAHKLVFTHPTTKKLVTFTAPIPKIFNAQFQ